MKDTVDVYFPSVKLRHTFERVKFEQYSSAERRILASRMQFPLDWWFGMTIHKAQGMILNAAVVPSRGALGPGQISVAIGRVRSSANLQVTLLYVFICLSRAVVGASTENICLLQECSVC